jgi:predicted DNA-binding WGR domain protein
MREIEKQLLVSHAQQYNRSMLRMVLNRALIRGQLIKNGQRYRLGAVNKKRISVFKSRRSKVSLSKKSSVALARPTAAKKLATKKTSTRKGATTTNGATNKTSKGGLTRLASQEGTPKPHPRSQEHCSDATVLVEDGGVYDAELNQQDRSKNMDKYYVLQVLQTDESFWLFTHWGRTGQAGQVKAQEFDTADDATAEFCKVFKQKTNCAWENRSQFVHTVGKYNFLLKNYAIAKRDPRLTWEYHLTSDPQGKPNGWYPYDGKVDVVHSASGSMEDYWDAFESNSWLDVRFVSSGSFTYKVDFGAMTQMNTSSSKVRPIRRRAGAAGASGVVGVVAGGTCAVGRLLAQMNPGR